MGVKKGKKSGKISDDNAADNNYQTDIKLDDEIEFSKTMDSIKRGLDKGIQRVITPDIAEIYSLSPEIACKLIISKINCWERLCDSYKKLKDIRFFRDNSLCKLLKDYNTLNDQNNPEIKKLLAKNIHVSLHKDVFFDKIGSINKECKKIGLVIPTDNSKNKEHGVIGNYVINSVSAFHKFYFLTDLKKFSKESFNISLNYENLDDSVYYILKNLSTSKVLKLEKYEEYKIDELNKLILNVFNNEFNDFYLNHNFIWPIIKGFFGSIIEINNLWLDIVNDKEGLKYIVEQIFYDKRIGYDESSLTKSYENLLSDWFFEHSNNWFFSCKHICFFGDLSSSSEIHIARECLKDQAKSLEGDDFSKTFTRENLIKRLKSFFGEETTDRMMKKIDDNDYQSSKDGLIDLEILMSLLYDLGEKYNKPELFSKSFYRDPEKKYLYSVSNFLANRKHWISEGASDINKNNGNVLAGEWVMEVAIIFIMIGIIQNESFSDFKKEKHKNSLGKILNHEDSLRKIFKKPHELSNLISFYKILSKYGLNLYNRQGLVGLLMAEFSPSLMNGTMSGLMNYKNDFVKKTFGLDNDKVISKILYCQIWDSFEKHYEDASNKYWELSKKNEKKQKRRKKILEILYVIGILVLMLVGGWFFSRLSNR